MLRKTTDISVTTYAQQQSVERRETYALSIHTISKFFINKGKIMKHILFLISVLCMLIVTTTMTTAQTTCSPCEDTDLSYSEEYFIRLPNDCLVIVHIDYRICLDNNTCEIFLRSIRGHCCTDDATPPATTAQLVQQTMIAIHQQLTNLGCNGTSRTVYAPQCWRNVGPSVYDVDPCGQNPCCSITGPLGGPYTFSSPGTPSCPVGCEPICQ